MKFENKTPYPALLFRTVIGDRRMAAAVVSRVTYDIVDGELFPSKDQVWKVSHGPWDGPQGPMEGDDVFYRGGVDLLLFGHACAPKGKEVTQLEVVVEAGSFSRKLLVFGDRVWRKTEQGLVHSPPEPFRSIPLALSRAYGGTDKWDGLNVPYPDNPEGRGFLLEEDHAVGCALPNIEDPDHLIRKWDDRPGPAGTGVCLPWNPLRARSGLERDDAHRLRAVRATFFNAAFPAMIVRRLARGDRVRIDGVGEGGPLSFRVPRTPVIATLQIGEPKRECALSIDQLGIEADVSRVFMTYRYAFRYVLRSMEKRSCDLQCVDLSPREAAS